MVEKLRDVLLVEDDEQMTCVISALLSMELNKVTAVRTLQAAIIASQAKRYDLVLLDLALLDASIETTLVSIPQFKRSSSLVVVITGSALTAELQELVANAGADELIAKTDPNFLVTLRRTVCSASFI